MHAKALSNARQFLRNYIERPIPYWENIVNGSDPRYLAKTPDFAVEYFEEASMTTKMTTTRRFLSCEDEPPPLDLALPQTK